MDRRSYLDSLNAGRIRRPQTSLEQLNRSLEHLEKQLQMRSTPPQAAVDSYQQTRRRLGEEASYYRPGQEDFAAPPPRPADDYRDTRAAELSYGRTNPDQSRIADELEALRNELRARLDGAAAEAAQSPAAGIAQELEALRAEMRSQLSEARRELSAREQGTPRSDGSMAEATEIKAEIERLTDAVHSLAHRTDDRPMNVLRLELEQARAAIDSLAREDTVRTIGDRWDDFERRMESFQENMTADIRSRPADPGVDALTARIEQMNTALNNLPDSLPLRSLDDKMRKLSMAVEKFVQQQETRQPQSLAAVETRLDEISRAIVASAVSANAGAPDTEQMRRIETRIAQLSRQIEESAKAQPAPPAFDEAGILDAIDERFGELSRRMDAARASEDAILGLQQRLESIATKLEQPVAAAPSVDPSLVSNLEAQIAGLSRFLSKPDPRQDEMRILAPRLDSLEKSIVGNRDLMVEAAREAADRAVRSMAGAPRDDLELASGLAGDLKQLEGLTRRSDERNAKTFEAIHDTLLKIVDRLGTLEQGDRTAVAEAVRRPVDMPETPALDPADDDQFEDDHIDVAAERPRLTPAQAAAAAAEAALGEAPNAPERSRPKRSMLGGLFNRKNAPVQTQPALAGMQEPVVEDGGAPSIDIDEPLDPRAGNRPLEPGSGAPDLNAIMRRVRDDRAQPGKSADAEAAKTDFIAAARRAAQAAAAEAQILKRGAEAPKEAGGRSSVGDLLKTRRKPILMAAAAVMIALAGLQLGKTFLNDPQDLTAGQADPVAEQSNETSSAEPPTLDAPAAEPEAAAPAVRQAEESANTAPAAQEPGQSEGEDLAAAPAPQDTDIQAVETEDPATSATQPSETGQPMEGMQASAPADGPVTETTSAAPNDADPAAPAALIEVPADAGPIPLREAAAGGDSKALFEIGARYADGRGTKRDLAKAAQWYEKSADLGFAPAQYRVGNLYEKGNGVTRDLVKAKTWYQLAANQGNASAMHNLAVLFAMGADGSTDNDSAARWFTQAADLGVKDSQFNLGILSAKGVGMPQNLEESYKWFALVAKAGDKDAATKRDEIAKSLRPEQLERARGSVDLWKPKELNAEANNAEIPESWQESPATTAGIDMKKAIRNVQAILNKNGYDAGGADGVMGKRTTDAIKAFQTDNGLEATGSVDKALVEALLAKK